MAQNNVEELREALDKAKTLIEEMRSAGGAQTESGEAINLDHLDEHVLAAHDDAMCW